jgi:TetR/AcrR family transcriptional repressor of nem operon
VLGLRVRERAGHHVERMTAAIDLVIRSLGPAPADPA